MFNRAPYYHGSVRKSVVAFGKMFDGIQIEREDSAGVVQQTIKVPVSYGNREKWLSRINEDPNLNQRILYTVPRIGFELAGMQYDPSRKLNTLIQVQADYADASGVISSSYAPVPYNLDFIVYVVAKTQDDALRITEQILPFFTPGYTLVLNLIPELDVIQNIPVVLTGMNLSDSFDGSFETRREIMFTLNFTMKIELFGPIPGSNVILHVDVKLGDSPGVYDNEYNLDVVSGTKDSYVSTETWTDLVD